MNACRFDNPNKIEQIKKHLKESKKQWRMAWNAGGHSQNDSPAGRFHNDQAIDIFRTLTKEEKAQLPEDMRNQLERDIEELDIMGDEYNKHI